MSLAVCFAWRMQNSNVSPHGVRIELLQQQAECLGQSLEIIEIPHPCSEEEYATIMRDFVTEKKNAGIEYFAFGDLHLENVRECRETKLEGTGIKPIFPLWGIPTGKLSTEMVDSGLKAIITCIDPQEMPEKFIGCKYDESFLTAIPSSIDPCGENGEFHSFTFDGPMFNRSLDVSLGEIVEREGFLFADLKK